MSKLSIEEVFDLLIELAERQLGVQIVDHELLEEESRRDWEQDKLWMLITLGNGKRMKICIHTFLTENEKVAFRFHGNYIH